MGRRGRALLRLTSKVADHRLSQATRRITWFESLETRWILAGPTVIETNPGIYALSVPLDTDVAILFDQSVAALSVTPNAIVVHAEFSGRLPIAPEDFTV